MTAFLVTLLAVSLSLLAGAWVAYPLIMRWFAMQRRPRGASHPPPGPVAVLIATRDEPELVARRVTNVRKSEASDPASRIVVAVDRTSPWPVEAYVASLGTGISVVQGDAPGGKACTLNAGMREMDPHGVVVLADTGQDFEAGAIRRLVEAVSAPDCGGATGRYVQRDSDSVMGAFARLEAGVRAGQAARRSIVSTSGSIYALRVSCWRPLPPGTICDDLFTTMSTVTQGLRVDFVADAVAVERRTFTRDQQFRRRVRTLTGLLQYVRAHPSALLPWSNPVWIDFVAQKLLRLATPILAVIALGSGLGLGILLAPRLLLVAGAVVLLGLLIAFLVVPARVRRLGSTLLWIARLQLVPLKAVQNALRGEWGVWHAGPTPVGPSRREGAA